MTEDLSHEARALGTLRLDQVRQAAGRHGLGAVIAVSDPRFGAVGNNVAIDTRTGQWILRGAPPPLTADQLRRERFFARLIHERTAVDAPWPYHVDGGTDIFGWPYAIMRRLPGDVPWLQENRDWRAIAASLGRVVAELHSITFPHHGRWDAAVDDIVAFDGSQSQWFGSRLTALRARVAETSEPLDAESDRFVDDAMAAAAIDGYEPSYVHGDLGIGNVVLGAGDDGSEVTGVFDLPDGLCADPDEDVVSSLWWPCYWRRDDIAAWFLQSYRAVRPARQGDRERLRAYAIAGMLGNWEVGRREKYPWYGAANTFREWAEPLADAVDRVVARV